jgi:hypothetical protein
VNSRWIRWIGGETNREGEGKGGGAIICRSIAGWQWQSGNWTFSRIWKGGVEREREREREETQGGRGVRDRNPVKRVCVCGRAPCVSKIRKPGWLG